MNLGEWFVGEHRVTLDAEGRLLLPSPLRALLNPSREERSFMASLEPEGCLAVRAPEQWEAEVRRLRASASHPLSSRRASLLLTANSARARLDRQGRLRVPDALLAKAGVERHSESRREVVIAGNFDELRLWSPGIWRTFEAEARAAYAADLALLWGSTEAPETAPGAS